MECPHCHSIQIRKASTVYEDGTQTSTIRTRGLGAGVRLGAAKGVGVGLFKSRGVSRSSTLAARKADKARPIWIGWKGGLAMFFVLCFVFASDHLYDPFGKALIMAVAIMIVVPAVTAIRAEMRNKDYGRRWYCDTCGELWTDPE